MHTLRDIHHTRTVRNYLSERMESKLTADEIAELKEHLSLVKKIFRQRIPFQLIFIVGALTTGICLNHRGLTFGGIAALIVSIYIDYQITWKWVVQLNSDIDMGIKQNFGNRH